MWSVPSNVIIRDIKTLSPVSQHSHSRDGQILRTLIIWMESKCEGVGHKNQFRFKFDCSQLWVWKRAVRFLPHEIISFRRKKWSSSEIPKFHKGDSSKLGHTHLGIQNISKVKDYFGWFQDSSPNFMNLFENGNLFHNKSFPKRILICILRYIFMAP